MHELYINQIDLKCAQQGENPHCDTEEKPCINVVADNKAVIEVLVLDQWLLMMMT
jgi:hypothetical protein